MGRIKTFFDNVFKVGIKNVRYKAKLESAYKRYAPVNQTFEDFQEMFESEKEFDRTLAQWTGFDEYRLRRLVELESKLQNADGVSVNKRNQLEQERNMWREHITPYSTFNSSLSKELLLIEQSDENQQVLAEIEKLRKEQNALGFNMFAPHAAHIVKQLCDSIDRLAAKLKQATGLDADDIVRENLDTEMQKVYDFYLEQKKALKLYFKPMHYSDKYCEYEKKLQDLYDRKNIIQDRKNVVIGKYLSDELIDKIAQERHQTLLKIIASDERLMLGAEFWPGLDMQKRQGWTQTVVNKLDKKYLGCSSGIKVKFYSSRETWRCGNSAFEINDNYGGYLGFDDVINVIKHEYSHVLDDMVADIGVLGKQMAYHSGKAHKNCQDTAERERYLREPTEIVAWRVGNYKSERVFGQLLTWRMEHNMPQFGTIQPMNKDYSM